MLENVTVVNASLAVGGLYLLKRLLWSKPQAPLPPGPKGLPLVGNVADMPKEFEWLTFAEWGNRYGGICSVTILGQTIVILNQAQYAYDMFDKKSTIYSDRPILMMGGILIGWDRALGLTRYGERFKSIRKMLYKAMGSREVVKQYYPLEELEHRRQLRRILENPENPADAIRKTVGAVIMKISHGYQVKEGVDPYVHHVDVATEQFSVVTQPGAYLVDVMPILRYVPSWFPGAGFQRKAAEWRRDLDKMADDPHILVKEQMAAGTAIPSFTSMHLEENDVTPEQETIIKWSAASLYGGGADTTVSASHVFFLAMTLYPEVQAKAQAEVDAVIGNDRLPGFNDRDNLPYLDALVKEVLRWNPVAPLGVPHRVMEDDVHEGYFIPKGTLVIPNIWKMLHEEKTYANPMAFNPDRFITTPTHEAEKDPKSVCFGFGRRICPGLHIAESSVWLSCAMSLAVFDVTKARDSAGKEIVPEPVMMSGTISHPKPFKCSIKPRSPKAEALITAVDFYHE